MTVTPLPESPRANPESREPGAEVVPLRRPAEPPSDPAPSDPPAAAPPAHMKRLSDVLHDIAQDPTLERVAIADLMQRLESRAIAGLLLVFAVPNVFPTLPGISGLLGMPLIYLSLQVMLGHKVWLPAVIAKRSLPRSDFAALIGRVSPLLRRVEDLLAPRLLALTTPPAVRVWGAVCLLLSVVLFLPIPLGNMLPAAAICLIALAILERDGIWVGLGLGVAGLSVAVVWGVLIAMAKLVLLVLGAGG